jgi:lipopolysaccharide/colanic/teichoic acid biosynthesis glycosyltransferase
LYKCFFKPLIDFHGAMIGLLLLSPVLLVAILLLLIVNKGKPFFFQKRPGKNRRIFKVIKLKTMNDNKDAFGNLLPDAERLTGIGKFIREMSLDEVPQLLNVIKGDMSLVGPRPLLVQYLPLYNERQARRHEVKPGITGLAQVNGRNTISWEQKFEYDTWYVEKMSFELDMKIICQTLLKVLKKEGINSESSVTMERFSGNA